MESKKLTQDHDQRVQDPKKASAPQFAFSSRVFSNRTAMRVDRTNFDTKWSSITNSPLDTVGKSKVIQFQLLLMAKNKSAESEQAGGGKF